MLVRESLRAFLTAPTTLAAWVVLVAVSVGVVWIDLRRNGIGGLMRFVWLLTVLYSGPVGVGVYYAAGRPQIARDSLWRRAARSVCHCYSGCGAGEVVGITLAAGVLSLGTLRVVGVTFALAFAFGYALTVGPLLQDGVPLPDAVRDAFYSETASIAVMEVVAIGVDVWLAAEATITQPLFWSSLAFSLSLGLAAAYPVNVLLVAFGVKEGMSDPRTAA